jgi:hypothetical protein
VENPLYGYVDELAAAIGTYGEAAHSRVASVLFDLPPADLTADERWWGKALCQMVLSYTSPEQLAARYQLSAALARDMADRFRRAVVAW